jgi:hypothetical protein
MARRLAIVAFLVAALAASAQSAAADPTNAKNAGFFTAVCGSTQLSVVVNGNGTFTPAHVIGSTAVFIPTAFDLTFTFTPSGGGAPEVESETSAKPNPPPNTVTCTLPAALNTITFPDGTFTASGTVTGFFTPRG